MVIDEPIEAEQALEKADQLYNQGNYQQAKLVFEQAAQLFEQGGAPLQAMEAWKGAVYCWQNEGNFEAAIALTQQYLNKSLALVGEQHALTVEWYRVLAVSYLHQNKYEQVERYGQKALYLAEQLTELSESDRIPYYQLMGIYCGNVGRYDEQLVYYQKSLSLALLEAGDQEAIGMSYRNVACNYLYRHDFDQGLAYLQKAMMHLMRSEGDKNFEVGRTYGLFSVAYMGKKEYPKAVEYAEKAVEHILAILGPQHYYLAEMYQKLGAAYQKSQQHQRALNCYEQALSIYQQRNSSNYQMMGRLYFSMAATTFQAQQLEQALSYAEQALHLATSAQNPVLESEVRLALAKIYEQQGLWQAALDNLPNQKTDIAYAIHLTAHCSEILYTKARLFFQRFQHETKDWNDLQAAAYHYQLCADCMDELSNSYKAEGSQLLLAANKTEIYEQAIEVTLLLDPTDADGRCFAYVEKSKAVLLHNQLKESEAKINAQLPTEQLEIEHQLRQQLTQLDQQLAHLHAQSKPDNSLITQVESQRFDVRQLYDDLIQSFEKNYPDYFQLKYNRQTVSVKQLQTLLEVAPNHTALLNFFVGSHRLFLFVVTANNYEVVNLGNTDNLAEQIRDYQTQLQNPLAKSKYIAAAQQLHNRLIAPAESLFTEVNRLVIITDGELSTLPFEALLTELPAPRTPFSHLPYLINRYSISYHQSATLWHYYASQNTSVPAEPSFSGFAPVYGDVETGSEVKRSGKKRAKRYNEATTRSVRIGGKEYKALLHAETELKNIAQLFTNHHLLADTFLHESATKVNFENRTVEADYVLVAAHSDYNDQHPHLTGIIFSPTEAEDAILYLAETYNLRLNARLVVLSCCETGRGKYAKGEGMLALHRGFLYAGAKNVIYTLFKIYDEAASQLTQQLFQAILGKQGYPDALRSAKQHLIAANQPPVFWAGFVLMGA